jgi:hypothetical protein
MHYTPKILKLISPNSVTSFIADPKSDVANRLHLQFSFMIEIAFNYSGRANCACVHVNQIITIQEMIKLRPCIP